MLMDRKDMAFEKLAFAIRSDRRAVSLKDIGVAPGEEAVGVGRSL